VVTPDPPSEDTIATSRAPSGGVKLELDTDVPDVLTAAVGDDGSSERPPAPGRISANAMPPVISGSEAPTVVAPGVPVLAVVRQVPYCSALVLSA